MASDALLFSLSLIDCLFLLFVTVYFVITLSDLECDYINATRCCSKLNKWVPVEIVSQSLLTAALLLVNFHVFLFLMNIPLTGWICYRYFNKPSGNIGVYDPAEIHNRHTLRGHMKETMVKLAFHLIFFFIYLYCMLVALLS